MICQYCLVRYEHEHLYILCALCTCKFIFFMFIASFSVSTFSLFLIISIFANHSFLPYPYIHIICKKIHMQCFHLSNGTKPSTFPNSLNYRHISLSACHQKVLYVISLMRSFPFVYFVKSSFFFLFADCSSTFESYPQ